MRFYECSHPEAVGAAGPSSPEQEEALCHPAAAATCRVTFFFNVTNRKYIIDDTKRLVNTCSCTLYLLHVLLSKPQELLPVFPKVCIQHWAEIHLSAERVGALYGGTSPL